jgi:ATP-dependent Lon protease
MSSQSIEYLTSQTMSKNTEVDNKKEIASDSSDTSSISSKNEKESPKMVVERISRKRKPPQKFNFESSSDSEIDEDYSPSDSSTSDTSSSESEKPKKRKISDTKEKPKKKIKVTAKPYESPKYDSDESNTTENESEEDFENNEKLKSLISHIADKLSTDVFDKAMKKAEDYDNMYDSMYNPDYFNEPKNDYFKPKDNSTEKSNIIELEFTKDNNKNMDAVLIVKPVSDNKLPTKVDNKKDNKNYELRKRPPDFKSTMSLEEKQKLETVEKQLFELNRHKVPPRYKILLSNLSLSSKQKILSNMDRLSYMNNYSSEYSKLTHWLDGVMSIPFDKQISIPISLSSNSNDISKYLQSVQDTMNNCIYGQHQAKQSILECVGKWVSNPGSSNRPLAFVGEKGTGKTTLAKYGIAEALNRPFFIISLGGESDASSFKGHDYTYEGARWGRIVDAIIQAKCMNPIILFDELDKVSETRQGEEIIGMLMHLTDTTQNDKFTDKYFAGIDIDMSKCLFIFSYNHEFKVNPILRDRITHIEFKCFSKKEKLTIAKNFLIPNICKKIGIIPDKYNISDSTLNEIINKYTPHEGGVRDLEKILERLFLRINLLQLPHSLDLKYKDVTLEIKSGKIQLTTKVIEKILKDVNSTGIPQHILYSMYS